MMRLKSFADATATPVFPLKIILMFLLSISKTSFPVCCKGSIIKDAAWCGMILLQVHKMFAYLTAQKKLNL